ncbi:MAG: SDR family NAD(P)-dependent oxidoreductase, partial [Bacilli bacterium]
MSKLKFADQVVIITGAGSGMGKAAAELFHKEGAIVIIADLPSSAGESVAHSLDQRGSSSI